MRSAPDYLHDLWEYIHSSLFLLLRFRYVFYEHFDISTIISTVNNLKLKKPPSTSTRELSIEVTGGFEPPYRVLQTLA